MASPEIFHRQDQGSSEIPRPISIKSQLSKYVGNAETKIPEGQEWARVLINKIPDGHKGMVVNFILKMPHEDRQSAAHYLSEMIEGMGDQIWRSRYPNIEIQHCMEATEKWLEVNKNKQIH